MNLDRREFTKFLGLVSLSITLGIPLLDIPEKLTASKVGLEGAPEGLSRCRSVLVDGPLGSGKTLSGVTLAYCLSKGRNIYSSIKLSIPYTPVNSLEELTELGINSKLDNSVILLDSLYDFRLGCIGVLQRLIFPLRKVGSTLILINSRTITDFRVRRLVDTIVTTSLNRQTESIEVYIRDCKTGEVGYLVIPIEEYSWLYGTKGGIKNG